MNLNNAQHQIQGLWDRLGRYATGTWIQRSWLVGELTHLLSCSFYNEER